MLPIKLNRLKIKTVVTVSLSSLIVPGFLGWKNSSCPSRPPKYHKWSKTHGSYPNHPPWVFQTPNPWSRLRCKDQAGHGRDRSSQKRSNPPGVRCRKNPAGWTGSTCFHHLAVGSRVTTSWIQHGFLLKFTYKTPRVTRNEHSKET